MPASPYNPGPATKPPVLAGRESVTRSLVDQLDRAATGGGHQPVLLVGERGMGKTVLLEQAVREARARGWAAARVEAQVGLPLAVTAATALPYLYDQLPGRAGRRPAWLREFSVTVGAHLAGAEVQVTPVPPAAPKTLFDSLSELLRSTDRGRRDAGVVLAVDELHQADVSDIRELGRLAQEANSDGLRFVLAGAGLPSLRDRILDQAPTYATRFDFHTIGPLSADATRTALVLPANQLGVIIEPPALDRLVEATGGYPYFVQLYGRHAWDTVTDGRITAAGVGTAHKAVIDALDAGPYGAAWLHLRPSEQRFLAAMAHTPGEPIAVSDVARRLGQTNKTLSPLRQRLLDAGMVEAAGHGLLRFSWPGYGSYIRARHYPNPPARPHKTTNIANRQAALRAARNRQQPGPDLTR